MGSKLLRGGMTALLVAGWLVGVAGAVDGNTTASTSDQVARLEGLLAEQERKLEDLRQQLAATTSQDADAARTEAMREQIRAILSEQEFRESLMPSVSMAGYDNGFYIKSSDDQFLMKINGYMQNRWTHYGTQSRNRYLLPRLERDDRTGFDIQRTRLNFSGHAWDQNLTYRLTLRADAPDGYDFQIHYAYVNYRFMDEFNIKAGMFQLASTRSQLTENYNFQFVDRGLFDAVYGLGVGVGVRFWGQLFDKRLDYYLDVVNSLNGDRNRTITTDPAELDGNPAILFRTVWHVLGDDLSVWDYEGDLNRTDSPHWDLAFRYAFNDDQGDRRTTRIPFPSSTGFFGNRGGYGLTTTNGAQINEFGLDSAFKWMGFSAIGEYVVRVMDPRRAGRRPFTPWWLLTGDEDTTAQHGAYVQVGYMLPIPGMEDKLEAVARVGGISTLAEEQEGSWEYAAGLNYYIKGHQVKLQTDVVKIYEVPISSSYSSLANVNDDALVWRVQLQVAF